MQAQGAESTLILELARGGAPAELELLLGQVDFLVLEEQLRRLKLLGLLGTWLLRLPLDGEVPTRFAIAVEEIVEAGRYDALRKQVITWRMLQELEKRGIVAMPLKGPFMSERLYGDAGMRLSADIDLLVSRSDMSRAVGALESTGAVRPRRGDRLPRLHHVFVVSDGPYVELHWRIHWYESSYAESMLDRSQMNAGTRVPAPIDEFVSLLLFHARDGLSGLRTPVDVSACWTRYEGEIPVDELHSIIGAHPAIGPAISAAAIAVDELLGIPLTSLLPHDSRQRRRTIAAVRLADWELAGSEATVDVNTAVIDGLLTGHGGFLQYLKRAALPPLPGPAWTRPLRQALHGLALAYRAVPICIRVLRERANPG